MNSTDRILFQSSLSNLFYFVALDDARVKCLSDKNNSQNNTMKKSSPSIKLIPSFYFYYSWFVKVIAEVIVVMVVKRCVAWTIE